MSADFTYSTSTVNCILMPLDTSSTTTTVFKNLYHYK